VTELSFDRTLYSGPALDEAVKAFDGFADFALSETAQAWVVRVEGPRERDVARELSNYALGLTIRARGQRR
jgi:hypothetical protein